MDDRQKRIDLGKPVTIQIGHTTLQYTVGQDTNGVSRPRLYVQAHDAYRYQRELIVEFRHRPGDLTDLYWECHAYQHPGRRCIKRISAGVARRLIGRILYVAQRYPTLHFNTDQDPGNRPRIEGFVHAHDALLWGAEPSCKLFR